jgi:hypothetical protein
MNEIEKVKLTDRLGKANLEILKINNIHPRFLELIENIK